MKACQSDLARRVLAAGIRIKPGVPFVFNGRTYVPTLSRRVAS